MSVMVPRPRIIYAPAIVNSAVRNMDYYDFTDVVVNGRKDGKA